MFAKIDRLKSNPDFCFCFRSHKVISENTFISNKETFLNGFYFLFWWSSKFIAYWID